MHTWPPVPIHSLESRPPASDTKPPRSQYLPTRNRTHPESRELHRRNHSFHKLPTVYQTHQQPCAVAAAGHPHLWCLPQPDNYTSQVEGKLAQSIQTVCTSAPAQMRWLPFRFFQAEFDTHQGNMRPAAPTDRSRDLLRTPAIPLRQHRISRHFVIQPHLQRFPTLPARILSSFRCSSAHRPQHPPG